MEIENIIHINQYEKRVIQYQLFVEGKFEPDGATIKIFDENCNLVIDQSCVVDSNKISIIVDETVTEKPGDYTLYWKIEKENQIFYKVTTLKVGNLIC